MRQSQRKKITGIIEVDADGNKIPTLSVIYYFNPILAGFRFSVLQYLFRFTLSVCFVVNGIFFFISLF